jgi:hypothetical protein
MTREIARCHVSRSIYLARDRGVKLPARRGVAKSVAIAVPTTYHGQLFEPNYE